MVEKNQKLIDQFLRAPFQQFCGLKNTQAINGDAQATLLVTEEVQNMSGYLHGGVIHAMLDVTSFCAAMSVMSQNDYPVTNNINISIYRPVKIGSEIKFAAHVRKKGRRLVVTHCEVFDISSGNDVLVAEGMVTKTILNNSNKVQFINQTGE